MLCYLRALPQRGARGDGGSALNPIIPPIIGGIATIVAAIIGGAVAVRNANKSKSDAASAPPAPPGTTYNVIIGGSNPGAYGHFSGKAHTTFGDNSPIGNQSKRKGVSPTLFVVLLIIFAGFVAWFLIVMNLQISKSKNAGGDEPARPSIESTTPLGTDAQTVNEVDEFSKELRRTIDDHRYRPDPDLLDEYFEFPVSWYDVPNASADRVAKDIWRNPTTDYEPEKVVKICSSEGRILVTENVVDFVEHKGPKADENQRAFIVVRYLRSDSRQPYRIKSVRDGHC